ncbi:MAG TPA: hypothetical protein ENF35_00500 [Aciduliprofundum sp.]|nr:hypothetical protein [Aciduliprofundum sp.]
MDRELERRAKELLDKIAASRGPGERAFYERELGLLYFEAGLRGRVEGMLIQASISFQHAGMHDEACNTYIMLGDLREGLMALDAYYAALDLAERKGLPEWEVRALLSLAGYYMRGMHVEEALWFVEKAWRVVESRGVEEHREAVEALRNSLRRMLGKMN